MEFSIKNGKLEGPGVDHKDTKKKGAGTNKKKYITLHYTAGGTFKNDVAVLSTGKAEVSCHLVIGRDGEVTQIGSFDDIQWHAGKSEWKGISGLNSYSIGIELTNPGWLVPVEGKEGKYQAHFKKIYDLKKDGLVLAKQKDVGSAEYGWLPYTDAQIQALKGVVKALATEYSSIEEAVGHEQISPGRKQDPGLGIIFSHELHAELNAIIDGAIVLEEVTSPKEPEVIVPPKEPVKPEPTKEDGVKWVKRRVTAHNGLRIRKTASTSGAHIGSLKDGDIIYTLWKPSGWLLLKQGGFVATRFTEVV